MHKRKLDELAIYQLESEADDIDIELLHDLYVEKTSDIVYLTLDDKLYGIICYGDLLHHMQNGIVKIVKNFTKLNAFCDDEARIIFASRNNIQKIPVVNKDDKLLGDYSRWEDGDTGWIHWIISQASIWNSLKSYLKEKGYQKVYIVNPIKEKLWIKDIIIELFASKKINVISTEKMKLSELLQEKEKSMVMAVDKEELRGVNCIDGYVYSTINDKLDWFYFSSLYHELKTYDLWRVSGHYGIAREGDNGKKIFMELQQKEIKVVAIYNDVFYVSDYIKELIKKVNCQVKFHKLKDGMFGPINSDWGETFFGDLLKNEDYQNGTAQKNILEGQSIHTTKRNANYISEYYNITDGRRKTLYQPQNYVGKIYMFGACAIMSIYLEDKYTIASLLQKNLNDAGYHYCVENCGAVANVFEKMKEITFHKGDIIIVWTGDGVFTGIDTVEIRHLYEENNVPPEWFLNGLMHANHRIASIIEEALYKKIKKYLKQGSGQTDTERGEDVSFKITNYADVMGNYVKSTYLNRYFAADDMVKYSWGAVIVDLNISPDMYEKILRKASVVTDHIIVFVPEGVAETEYSFKEYLCAIQKFTLKGIDIKVVSGEKFVPYYDLLSPYYCPWRTMEIEDVRQEVKFFAECMARSLNIKYRFDYGQHTNENMILYSQIVKEELPKYGIEYFEFL